MAKIHLVRHGQAAAGFGTHRDPGLSELGRSQAEAVADMLAPLGPLAVFSSPLARAYETAQPLAARWQVEITLEPRVAEIPSPSDHLEARSAWLREAMQGTWRDLGALHVTWRNEVVRCLLEAEADCVMFSHYVAINAAVGAAQHDDRLLRFSPDNCSVTTLDNSHGALTVVSLGRTAADTRVN